MPLQFDGLDTWHNQQEKLHIYKEIVSAFGTRVDSVTCEIGSTSDGHGITITFRGTPHPASLILASGDEWRKPGVIEKMVREALADAEDPARAERLLLGVCRR